MESLTNDVHLVLQDSNDLNSDFVFHLIVCWTQIVLAQKIPSLKNL